jgi:hypothetical protein
MEMNKNINEPVDRDNECGNPTFVPASEQFAK